MSEEEKIKARKSGRRLAEMLIEDFALRLEPREFVESFVRAIQSLWPIPLLETATHEPLARLASNVVPFGQ